MRNQPRPKPRIGDRVEIAQPTGKWQEAEVVDVISYEGKLQSITVMDYAGRRLSRSFRGWRPVTQATAA